jgi:hypothetical protein
MKYAIFTRKPRARTFDLIAVVPPEQERVGRTRAYQSLPRRQGDVEVIAVPSTFAVPHLLKSTGVPKYKTEADAALVAENEEAAANIADRLDSPREQVKVGTDYGLALALTSVLNARGRAAHIVSSFSLFGNDPTVYEVTVYPA